MAIKRSSRYGAFYAFSGKGLVGPGAGLDKRSLGSMGRRGGGRGGGGGGGWRGRCMGGILPRSLAAKPESKRSARGTRHGFTQAKVHVWASPIAACNEGRRMASVAADMKVSIPNMHTCPSTYLNLLCGQQCWPHRARARTPRTKAGAAPAPPQHSFLWGWRG